MLDQQVKEIAVTGTGASLSIEIGFTPKSVDIIDKAAGLIGYWHEDMADGEAIVNNEYIDTIINSACLSIGTTAANVASKAFQFRVSGVPYNKAAVAAGTAPTATAIPEDTWGLFGFEIGADGTVDQNDAADNATGYATEALAIAARPATSASHCMMGYVTVMKSDGAFTGATTAFNADNVTANFYSVSDARITSGGVTPIGSGDVITSGTVVRADGTIETPSTSSPKEILGITLGTSAYLNQSGQELIIRARR